MLFEKDIKNAFSDIGINLSEHQIKQFQSYYTLLVDWNSKMNLTAITEPEEVLSKHFVDSVLAAKVFDFKKSTQLMDIGTGAGFPGVPLKIVFPHLNVTLVDALNKRVQFLNTLIEELSLVDIEAIHGRAEDLARTEMRASCDVIVSRAVSQLNVLCEYCLPFLAQNGYFISYKGAKTIEELDNSHNAILTLGGSLEKVTDDMSLNGTTQRGFVVIKKTAFTPEKYPRRSGKPQKKPL